MPSATARKLEFMLRHFKRDDDVRLKPIALTAEQIEFYNLPRTPIKETERRAKTFEDAFGIGAVELDALEALYPGELRTIVSKQIAPYYSTDAQQEMLRAKRQLIGAVSEQVQEILSRYEDVIEGVKEMQEELSDICVDATAYVPPPSLPQVQETDDWLFDTNRDYITQIGFYKSHKGRVSAVGESEGEE